MKRRALRVGVFAIAVVACQTAPPPPPPEALITPIDVPEGTDPILFKTVTFRIPAGTRIGAWYWRETGRELKEIRWGGQLTQTSEFNVSATDHLARYGYNAVDPTDALLTDADHVKTRFKMGAVVTSVRIDGHVARPASTSYATADVEMEVQLYDSARQELVFERSYSGWGVDRGSDPRPLVPAVMNGMDKALTDEAFVELVAAPSRSGPDHATGAITLSPCPLSRPRKLPGDVESAQQAVVTIRAGSVTGSGFIVSPDGDALTAAHVVSGADQVQAKLASGIELEARVLRINRRFDVALIRIPGSGHQCLATDLAEDPPVGSDVFVIGSPLGDEYELSVTKGVVSGHRTVQGVRMIQTDASTNPGNSGGPLLAPDGRVAGILTQKVFGLGIEGMAFALPIHAAEQTLSIEWGPPEP